MMKRGPRATIASARTGVMSVVFTVCLLVGSTGQALAQESAPVCEDEYLSGGTLGIGLFQCAGGACTLYRPAGTESSHGFSVEPRVWDLSEPASGGLKDGDIILSVDGQLITTRRGGRRLASVKPGQEVELRIRRGKNEKTVSLIAVEGCEMSRLVMTTQIPPD